LKKPLPRFIFWLTGIAIVGELLIPTGIYDKWYWGTTVGGVVIGGCIFVVMFFITVTYGDYE
jgi:hypothetical protein